MLNILEQFVSSRGYTYFRLDGSTPVASRQPLIKNFNEVLPYQPFSAIDSSLVILLSSTGQIIIICFFLEANYSRNKRGKVLMCSQIARKGFDSLIGLVILESQQTGAKLCGIYSCRLCDWLKSLNSFQKGQKFACAFDWPRSLINRDKDIFKKWLHLRLFEHRKLSKCFAHIYPELSGQYPF